jgi:hypothetical protein
LSSGVADPSSEVADGTSEATYVAMQPQEGHVEETIASMDTSDDVGSVAYRVIYGLFCGFISTSH